MVPWYLLCRGLNTCLEVFVHRARGRPFLARQRIASRAKFNVRVDVHHDQLVWADLLRPESPGFPPKPAVVFPDTGAHGIVARRAHNDQITAVQKFRVVTQSYMCEERVLVEFIGIFESGAGELFLASPEPDWSWCSWCMHGGCVGRDSRWRRW